MKVDEYAIQCQVRQLVAASPRSPLLLEYPLYSSVQPSVAALRIDSNLQGYAQLHETLTQKLTRAEPVHLQFLHRNSSRHMSPSKFMSPPIKNYVLYTMCYILYIIDYMLHTMSVLDIEIERESMHYIGSMIIYITYYALCIIYERFVHLHQAAKWSTGPEPSPRRCPVCRRRFGRVSAAVD